MCFDHPTLVSWVNYKYGIEISIGIKDKIYKYMLPVTTWSLRLPDRKRLTFRDANKAKKYGKIIGEN